MPAAGGIEPGEPLFSTCMGAFRIVRPRPRPCAPSFKSLCTLLALAAVLLALSPAPPVEARTEASGQQVSLLADPAFRATADRGLAALYDMDFATADREFGAIARRHGKHPVGPFLGALTTWWRIQRDPLDTSHDARFFAAMEETLARAEARLRRDPQDPDGKFFQGGALAFRGRLRSMRGAWLPAARDCKRALGLVREVVEEDPRNADLYFGLGLYDYFGDVLPERHPILRPVGLFLPPAERERGLAHLERVVEDGHFVRVEAAWFLLQIHFHFERDSQESLRWARWLRGRYPGNSLFHELHGRALLLAGRRDAARAEFRTILSRFEAGHPAYTEAQAERAHYALGYIHLNGGEYRTALSHLQRLDRLTERHGDREVPLRTLGYLRQGMAFDALGRRAPAIDRYRRVLAADDTSRAHERARRLLREPWRPAGEGDGEG